MKVSKPTSSHRYYVRFKDHYDRWQRVRAFGDKAASNELGRKIEKLVGLRAIGQTTDPATGRWREGRAVDHREKFAAWGLLDAKVSSLSKQLTQNLSAREQELARQNAEEARLQGTYQSLVTDLEDEVAAGQIEIRQLREGLTLNVHPDSDSCPATNNTEERAWKSHYSSSPSASRW